MGKELSKGVIMSKKSQSTFEREMQDIEFREEFNKTYRTFLLSEFILTLMEREHKSVRQLASQVGLSPTVIQKIRSGQQQDIKLSNFTHILEACGYHVELVKGKERITIN